MQPPRIHGLEGVRGILAVYIFVHHFLLIFHPQFYFGEHNFWNQIFNGDLAVSWFFVHSGLVLGMKKDLPSIWSQIKRRYLRLLFPVLAAVLLSFLLMKLGLMFNQEFGKEVGSQWLASYLRFEPDLLGALWQSVYGCFFDFRSSTSYDPVLWTISYELISSYLLFGSLILLSFISSNRLKLFFIILAALVVGPWKGFMPFMFGLSLTYLPQDWKIPSWLKVILALVALSISHFNSEQTQWNSHLRSMGAALVMMVLLLSPKLRNFLSKPLFQRLGEMSYCLYLFHFPLLASVTSWIGLNYGSSLTVTIMNFILTSLILFPLSWAGEKLIDKPGIKFSKWITKSQVL